MIAAVVLQHEEVRVDELLSLLEELSSSIEVSGPHSFLFEGSAEEAYLRLKEAGIAIHGVAEAPTRFVAELAATEGGCHRIHNAEAYLAPLSISCLPLAGETQRRLHLLGLETMGAVAKLKKSDLLSQFGEEGAFLYDRVRGRDPTPIHPTVFPEPLIATLDFEGALSGSEALLEAMQQKVAELFLALQLQHKLCTRMRIRFILDSGRSALGYLNFASPLDEAERVRALMRNRLEQLELPEPIAGVQIALEGLVAHHAAQLDLFAQPKAQDQVERLVEQLKTRREPFSLMRVIWRNPDHRIPERRAQLQDLVEKSFTRALCLPTPIKVATDSEGRPTFVKVREGWEPVDLILQAWELDEEWWTSQPVMRSYFRAFLANGILLRLFYDRHEGSWFRQQV